MLVESFHRGPDLLEILVTSHLNLVVYCSLRKLCVWMYIRIFIYVHNRCLSSHTRSTSLLWWSKKTAWTQGFTCSYPSIFINSPMIRMYRRHWMNWVCRMTRPYRVVRVSENTEQQKVSMVRRYKHSNTTCFDCYFSYYFQLSILTELVRILTECKQSMLAMDAVRCMRPYSCTESASFHHCLIGAALWSRLGPVFFLTCCLHQVMAIQSYSVYLDCRVPVLLRWLAEVCREKEPDPMCALLPLCGSPLPCELPLYCWCCCFCRNCWWYCRSCKRSSRISCRVAGRAILVLATTPLSPLLMLLRLAICRCSWWRWSESANATPGASASSCKAPAAPVPTAPSISCVWSSMSSLTAKRMRKRQMTTL